MINAIATALASLVAAQANSKEPAAYGLATAQSVAEDGGETVRAFFSDGYGNRAGAVAFIRRVHEEPQVEVRVAGGRTLTTVVSLGTWKRVRTAAALFDRTLVPVPKGEVQSICLHPWSVSVEVVDPIQPGRPAALRASAQSACNEGLAVPLGFELAREAVAALPACALLDAKQYRNDVARLAGCTLLEGDRAAAALARNAYGSDWFASPRGERTEYGIRHLFFEDARVDWAGTLANGSEAAAKLWSGRLENASLFPQRIVGETANRVQIEGTIVRYTENQNTKAPVKMVWTSENGFGFRLRSATVGPDEPAR